MELEADEASEKTETCDEGIEETIDGSYGPYWLVCGPGPSELGASASVFIMCVKSNNRVRLCDIARKCSNPLRLPMLTFNKHKHVFVILVGVG